MRTRTICAIAAVAALLATGCEGTTYTVRKDPDPVLSHYDPAQNPDEYLAREEATWRRAYNRK